MEGFFCVGGARGAPNAKKQRTENREQRTENREQRTENREQSARQARDEESDGREWEVCPAGLTRRTTKAHKEGRKWGTADYADWSRLGAGCRRQDSSVFLEITKDTKDTKGFWLIRGLKGVGRCPTPRQGEVLPAPPARLRRAIKTTTRDSGDAGDAGAPLRGDGR